MSRQECILWLIREFFYHPLILHNLRLFQLLRESLIHFNDRLPEYQSHDQGHDKEDAKFSKIDPVIHTVKTADCLAQGCHTVGKRKQRIHGFEESRCNFDWEGSAGSGYLHNQKYDTDCFSDISEGYGQRVNDIDIHDAGDPSGEKEEERVLALDAEVEQITKTDQGTL